MWYRRVQPLRKSPFSLWSGPPRRYSTVAARLLCAYKIRVSINARKKPGRGRPAVDSEEVRSRIHRPILAALDAWIASQPDPKPTRSEAIRIALKDWLIGLGLMSQYDDVEALKQKIADLKPAASGKPTPARGMAMLRRGRAKSDLAKAKNKRAKAPK
jgi:hypothetical protein